MTVLNKKPKLEFCRCLVASMAHITRADRELLWEISERNIVDPLQKCSPARPIDAARFDDGYMVKTYIPRGADCGWKQTLNGLIQELRDYGFSEAFCLVFNEACQHRSCYLLRLVQDTASPGCFPEQED